MAVIVRVIGSNGDLLIRLCQSIWICTQTYYQLCIECIMQAPVCEESASFLPHETLFIQITMSRWSDMWRDTWRDTYQADFRPA